MNICLIRHGEDEDNAADILNGRRNTPLTALGKGQAVVVAGQLRSKLQSIDILYSSPLQRAVQAAFYGWGWEQGIRNAHMDNAGVLQLHGS